MSKLLGFTIASLVGATTVLAQPKPKPAPVDEDKDNAKALLQSGLKLFAAKDYLGALSVFETAYARFPSAKILLNIATTLRKLDRNADAANAYQRYLDARDSDAAKQADVTSVLSELDANLGVVSISVDPADAEIQIGTGAWAPAGEHTRIRVAPGEVLVHARKAGYAAGEEHTTIAAGATRTIALTLVADPTSTSSGTSGSSGSSDVDDGLQAGVETPTRSRFGALALAHIDPANRGMAGVVGVTADAIGDLRVQAAAILGPSFGVYAGASFAFLDGRFRPIVVAGLPVFFSDGARVSLRAAAGLELALDRHFALIAELGVEYALNPEPTITRTLFIPAIGATARL